MSRSHDHVLGPLLAHCEQARRHASILQDLSVLASLHLQTIIHRTDARRAAARAPGRPPAPVGGELRRQALLH